MFTRTLTGLAVLLFGAASVRAEVIRFRYVAADATGNTVLAAGPQGAPAERAAWLGGPYEPYGRSIQPPHMVTFRHPVTGQNLNVPMAFPDSTPRMASGADRVVYNFTTYQIIARFLPDGSVQVIYNSGVLRPVSFG
jgi:hypothetical protein